MRKRSLILSIHKEREREAVRERLEHEGGRCVWYQNQKHLGGGGTKEPGSSYCHQTTDPVVTSLGCHRPCGLRLDCRCFQ